MWSIRSNWMSLELLLRNRMHKKKGFFTGKDDFCGESFFEKERAQMEKTFKERYLNGEIEFEEIDEYCFQWGISDETRTLREYLGFSVEEEDAWVNESEEALRELLDGQKRK